MKDEEEEMSDKMRLTAHNGRGGKNGAYSSKHNDRNFDTATAPHIDDERSNNNRTWVCYEGMTFDDAEALFYERHFREILDERNEKAIEQRHPERVRTMEDYRKSMKSCPEETIMQIGKAGQTIDPNILWQICCEQIAWEEKTFPNCKYLDYAMHTDEEGAPHLQARKVWIAHDQDGREQVGQAKALAEMGIEAPDKAKKFGKYNNAKMTHTAECRAHFAEICKAHGLDLELEPKEASKSGLSLTEYQRRQEEDKAERARQAQAELKEENARISSQNALKRSELEKADKSLAETNEALKKANKSLNEVETKRKDLMSKETFSKELLSSKQVEAIEAKPTMFDKDKVVLSAKDFERLKKSAAAAENLLKEIAPARKINKSKNDLLQQAQTDANAIIADARKTAKSMTENLASAQLNKVRKDFPHLFDQNIYQGLEWYEQKKDPARQKSHNRGNGERE